MSTASNFFNVTTPAIAIFTGDLYAPNKLNNKYGCELLFKADNPDLAPIKDIIINVAKAKWPNRDVIADFKAGKLRLPYENGDSRKTKWEARQKEKGKDTAGKRDAYVGMIVMPARNEDPPTLAIVGADGKVGPALDGAARAGAKSKFYSGVETLAQLSFFAYSEGTNEGVGVRLKMLVSTGNGKQIGNAGDPQATFAAYKGSVKSEDPTAGLKDEIPF